MNYFELFSIPERPIIDRSILSKRFFELQRKFHPDYHTDDTENEQLDILELSSAVNKAYAIFKDDQKTIAYYLQTKGFLEEEEKYNLPADFLMEMMEVNELLDDGEIAKVKTLIADTEAQMDLQFHQIVANLSDNIAQAEVLKIKDYYFRKKYLRRILDRLND
jgi:molecular chaperone HscB